MLYMQFCDKNATTKNKNENYSNDHDHKCQYSTYVPLYFIISVQEQLSRLSASSICASPAISELSRRQATKGVR